MKPLLLTTILAISTTLTQATFACDIHGKSGIAPENKLYIPVGEKSAGGITEVQFNQVIDRISALYTDKVAQLGGKLIIKRNWTDGTVNAYADRNDADQTNWNVSMFGGLARHPEMNTDAFAIVLCHELGHQIGGAPKKLDKGLPTWAANEGQADYFATLKCVRNYFEGSNNQEVVTRLNVPALVTSTCQKSFASAEEIAICQRSAMAGMTLANFFKVLMKSKIAPNFSTPDPSKVAATDDNHPQTQCRLDTYFQGSVCDKSVTEDVSDTDENVGTCTAKNGDILGLRPSCWFKESL